MSIKLRHLTPFLIAGAAAAAIAAAPTAQADGSPTCRDNGSTSICQKQGHASIVATPRDSGSNSPMSGAGMVPAQMWALG